MKHNIEAYMGECKVNKHTDIYNLNKGDKAKYIVFETGANKTYLLLLEGDPTPKELDKLTFEFNFTILTRELIEDDDKEETDTNIWMDRATAILEGRYTGKISAEAVKLVLEHTSEQLTEVQINQLLELI